MQDFSVAIFNFWWSLAPRPLLSSTAIPCTIISVWNGLFYNKLHNSTHTTFPERYVKGQVLHVVKKNHSSLLRPYLRGDRTSHRAMPSFELAVAINLGSWGWYTTAWNAVT